MLEDQNSSNSMQLLKAMRYYYNKAKVLFNIRILGSVGVPLLSISIEILRYKEIISIDLTWLFALLGSLWLLVFFILGLYESKHIECGAKIQEEFDTNIFKLSWNGILIGDRVSPEDILDNASKYSGDLNKLRNWYGGLISNKHYLNVILAQRSNLMWALSLKKNYIWFIASTSFIYLIITIFGGIALDISLREYMVVVFIPSLAIFVYSAETISRLFSQININKRLGEEIREICENSVEDVDSELCRKYQDAIFIYNRLQAVLIPEKLYWLRRDSDDKKMIEINKMLSEKSYKRV